ncbi:MAG: hypothetical protein HY021_13320, partial [Burkholderiales bacterium]|nr:hypothetical protein [Burkholderiales bacterium]
MKLQFSRAALPALLCLAAAASALAQTPARGWLAVSANDHKAVLVDGVAKILANPTPDT